MADFKNKVVYQIYPKSFKDSNGDGIGDLRGVIDALDYLADMGVDYLWLTPFFVSPQKDNGYDIADYLAIDPHFGTMDDFDALVKAADAKGLKIMLDMVLCHTSDQHAWFQRALAGDADAPRERGLRYRAADFVPVMALPSNVDHVAAIRDLEPVAIDQVFLGSCTNGRLEDLMAAAEILKGKHIAPFVKLIVTPASRKIWEEAEANGTLAILSAAGAMITPPSCGLCCGRTGGILSDGERVVATNNRNFLGRMGSSKVEIYLASPKSAAASALTGRLTEATC